MSARTPRALVVGRGAASVGALAALRSGALPLRVTHLPGVPRALDHARRRVVGPDGTGHGYEVALLSPGGRPRPAPPHAITLAHGRGEVQALAHLLAGLDGPRETPVVLVAPPHARWVLRLYALALAVRRLAGARLPLVLVTAEAQPAAALGTPAAELVAGLLADAAIEVHPTALADLTQPGWVTLSPGRCRLAARRVVCLPTPRGPALTGAPRAAGGFIAAGPTGAVAGCEGVFAAGTATAMAQMHPTVGIHQGWRAGRAMLRALGADVPVPPPWLHGRLAAVPEGGLRWWAPPPDGVDTAASPPPPPDGWQQVEVTLPLDADPDGGRSVTLRSDPRRSQR